MVAIWKARVPKADTRPEMAMRKILEGLGLSFVSQEPIKTRFREWPFIVDFLVERKLVVEVHGRYWHSKRRRQDKDQIKKECLEAEGYRVVEVPDDSILNFPEIVAETILDFVAELRRGTPRKDRGA